MWHHNQLYFQSNQTFFLFFFQTPEWTQRCFQISYIFNLIRHFSVFLPDPTMNTEMPLKKAEEREALRGVIQQWNANRLDLFELSEPNEVSITRVLFSRKSCWRNGNRGNMYTRKYRITKVLLGTIVLINNNRGIYLIYLFIVL